MQVWGFLQQTVCFCSCQSVTPVKMLGLCWILSLKNKWTQWSNIIPRTNLSLFILSVVITEKLFRRVNYQAENLRCVWEFLVSKLLFFRIAIFLVKIKKICRTSLPDYLYMYYRKGVIYTSPNSKLSSSHM